MLLHANQPVPVSPELKGVVQRQIYRLIVPDDNVYTYMHVYIYTTHNSRSLVLKWNPLIFPWHPWPVSPEQGTIPPPPPDEPAPATAARQAWEA